MRCLQCVGWCLGSSLDSKTITKSCHLVGTGEAGWSLDCRLSLSYPHVRVVESWGDWHCSHIFLISPPVAPLTCFLEAPVVFILCQLATPVGLPGPEQMSNGSYLHDFLVVMPWFLPSVLYG